MDRETETGNGSPVQAGTKDGTGLQPRTQAPLYLQKITPEEAKPKLDEWCKDVGKSLIRELISVRDTIRQKETEILNYFSNRSTNASAESLNSKIKGFRAQLRGVHDLPFFMYRLTMIFG